MPALTEAVRLLQAGRPADAIAHLRQAATQQPLNPIIHHDLGLACLEAGHLAQAVAALRQATSLNPTYTDAYFRLGIALEKQNDAHAAILAYDRTTELLPGHTEAWFRAGSLVFTLGHRAEAIGCFRRAAATGPKTAFGRLGAARALLAENRDGEAEKILRRTLALDPGNAIAQDLLGNLLADSGRFDEARACFARAIEAAPLMAGCYYDLVRCRRVTPDDADLPAAMQAALATPGLDDAQIFRLHLAIGKAADDLQQYALAMRHFDAAYEVRRRTTPFDAAAFDAGITRLIALITPDFLARAQAEASMDATPILITGLPRSGTTLVEQILSSHPDVAAGDELNFWNERGPAWLQADTPAPDGALRSAVADYLALLRTIGPTAARVTDKMPFNIIWAGLIHAAFPRATIIHCRRAPIDVALSIHQTHFNPRLAFPTGGAELVAYIRTIHRLAAHWATVLPENRFIQLDYEDLTANPEPVIRRLIEACGLPWHDACLHPEQNRRLIKTASKWQARQPIYRTATQRWRAYEPYLGELRALLTA
jgi:cytochrome c-type biogenesis protein CcmH/NrfG